MLSGCIVLSLVFCSSVLAENISPLCQPAITNTVSVATPSQRQVAGAKVVPPLTDSANGFAWPDTGLSVLSTPAGLVFFASDGGHHNGNDKYGSVTRTSGTLNNPLGDGAPIDVVVSPNPDSSINPNYPTYTYLGGVKVFRIPQGQPGAGKLIGVYHAEIDTETSFYSLLGLASSSDGGARWTDLGEIVRVNQPYASDLSGFDIGIPPLVIAPGGEYFYLYFQDWIANGSTQPETVTHLSAARASLASVFAAASSAQPHAAAFSKYYEGAWTQPGVGGLSTDLNPDAAYQGSLNAAFNSVLDRYAMTIDDTQNIAYAESIDGLAWTLPTLLVSDTNPQTGIDYAVPLGMGENPTILGVPFYVFFTKSSPQGWPGNSVVRLTVNCK